MKQSVYTYDLNPEMDGLWTVDTVNANKGEDQIHRERL